MQTPQNDGGQLKIPSGKWFFIFTDPLDDYQISALHSLLLKRMREPGKVAGDYLSLEISEEPEPNHCFSGRGGVYYSVPFPTRIALGIKPGTGMQHKDELEDLIGKALDAIPGRCVVWDSSSQIYARGIASP